MATAATADSYYGSILLPPGNGDPSPNAGHSPSNPQHPSDLHRTEHLGKHRQYARDMILGVNDGIISTFLLVAGVSGSGLTTTDIFLTAAAGALAGAVSMSAGEFIATKSQNEVLQGEIGLERTHIRDHHQDELDELAEHLNVIGIPPEAKDLRQRLVEHYSNDGAALLRLMVALEFGVVEQEERSPLTAALFSGILFFVGSLPSLLPFGFASMTPSMGLLTATICTSITLLVVGGVKTWATRGNCWTAAMENLAVAGLGGLFAFAVGRVLDKLVH